MYLRLAFAVAAHLEPEILLVDEVLAVGDAQFQKKCLGKMGDVANEGRTVLFVSHNMGAIRNLCNSGVFLHGGEVHQRGGIADSVEAYYRSIGLLQSQDNMLTSNAPGTVFGPVRVNGSLTNIVGNSDAFELSTTLAVTQQVNGFSIFCILEDMNGHTLFHVRDESNILGMSHVPIGQYGITLAVPALPLNPGLYSVYFKVIFWGGRASARHLSDKFPLDVVGTSSLTDAVLHPRTTWHIEMEHGESICE
jgi:lipopolysaccharide transport system ATP-binding protein